MTGVRNPMPGVVYMPDAWRERYCALGVYTGQTLIGAFRRSFAAHADRIAVSEGAKTVTYRELDRASDRTAAALWRLGLRPTDRALIQMRNCIDLFHVFFGCLKIGVIPVCALAAHRAQEIGYLGNHAAARAHFVDGGDPKFDLVAFAAEMRKRISSIEHVIVARGVATGDALSLADLIEAEDADDARTLVDSIDLDPWQVALFQLSGGTSGIPKIIPHVGNQYRYTIQAVIDWMGFDETLVAFTPNPFMHNAPMAQYWGPALLAGGEVAIATATSLSAIEATMAARRPNWIALAKVHMLRLAEAGAFDRLRLGDIYGCVVTDSAPQLSALTGAPCLPIFGMTEGLLCITRPCDREAAAAGCVGRPITRHEELRIVAPGTEEDLPEGEVGELLVRGPCTIRGYYDALDQDREAFTSDGFYRSGDLLRFRRIDGARFLVFEGRVKDVVDRGGEKINCSEVEKALALHPAVGAVACVAMPDPMYGERMCAFVVPREGAGSFSCAEAGTFLESHGLARFKLPEHIELVADLPMTTSGKVSKPRMREIIAAKLAAEHPSGRRVTA